MTDLTERLAAKLARWIEYDGDTPFVYVENAADLLPLLLSEPELVATLSEEVRRSVLTPRERAVMKLGEAQFAYAKCPAGPFYFHALDERDYALAEVRKLTPEAA